MRTMKNLITTSLVIIMVLFMMSCDPCDPCDPDDPDCVECYVDNNAECTYAPNERLFNFGFENVTIFYSGKNAFFSGIDAAFSTHNNWDEWMANLRIYFEGDDATQRNATIVADLENPNNSVLKCEIISTNNGEKARVDFNYKDITCMREYHQTCKVYLPKPNMDHLQQYSESINWLTMFEFWTNKDMPKKFRVNAGLYKPAGAGEELVFRAKADEFNNPFNHNDYTPIWDEKATDFPVPFGQWLEIELYILEGDADNGRFYMAMTYEENSNKQTQVLFDINNYTTHSQENNQEGYTRIQPLKWYTNGDIVNHMKDGGYSLDVYWDDLVVHRNKQP